MPKRPLHPTLRFLFDYVTEVRPTVTEVAKQVIQFLRKQKKLAELAVSLGINRTHVSFPNINNIDDDGNTVLIVAARHGHWALVNELIVTAQAELEIKNDLNRTALDEAVRGVRISTIRLLLEHHASGRDPKALYECFTRCDQRDPDVLILLSLCDSLYLYYIFPSKAKFHLRDLEELTTCYRYNTKVAIQQATDICDDVINIISDYDAPLSRIGFFFDSRKIRELLSKNLDELMNSYRHKTNEAIQQATEICDDVINIISDYDDPPLSRMGFFLEIRKLREFLSKNNKQDDSLKNLKKSLQNSR